MTSISLFFLSALFFRQSYASVLTLRQDNSVPPPPESGSSSITTSNGTDGAGGPISMAIIIPVSVVIGLLFVLVILWVYRAKLFPGLTARLRSTSTSSNPSGNLTAEELASAPTSRRRRQRTTAQNTTANAETAANTDGQAPGRANTRTRRNRRWLRRTESGRSIRTLPEYSKEAGDEELVLVRQKSGSTLEDDDYTDDEMENHPSAQDGPEVTMGQTPGAVTGLTRTDPPMLTRTTSSEQNEQELLSSDNEPTAPASAPLGDIAEPPRRSLTQISRRGWGEAPTYLEAMSSPSFEVTTAPDLEAGVPPPRTRNTSLRDRTSTSFRKLLSRAGMTFGNNNHHHPPTPTHREMLKRDQRGYRHSSTSLLLHPTASRMSTLTRESSASPYPSPWASTNSLHISSPVPNTAIRASFDTTHIPKAGLTQDQMRFLSSSEAVNLMGVKLDVPPKRRRRSTVTTMMSDGVPSPRIGSDMSDNEVEGEEENVQDEVPPPSWQELNEERRRNEAQGRVGLALPVTSGNPSRSDEHAAGISGDGVELEDRARIGTEATVQVGDAAVASGASASGQQQSPMSTDTPHSHLTVNTSQSSAALSGQTPSLEIEPPTPISPAYPPRSAAPTVR